MRKGSKPLPGRRRAPLRAPIGAAENEAPRRTLGQIPGMNRRIIGSSGGIEPVSGKSLGEILGTALKRSAEAGIDPLQSDYKWHTIEPLSPADREIDLAAMKPLYDTWRASKERLSQSSSEGLKEFNARLIRRLSIETGILERLYDLDRGTTEALIVHGFVEDLVSRSSTDIEPSRLIDILRDQEAAIQLVMVALPEVVP
jgi:hypothetical protein